MERFAASGKRLGGGGSSFPGKPIQTSITNTDLYKNEDSIVRCGFQ